jgi:hypothetical protein
VTWRKQRTLVTGHGHQARVSAAAPQHRWRLIRWALLRLFWVIALAGAAFAWWHAQSDTDGAFTQLTRFTTATAAQSAFNQPGSLRVDVTFTARPGGRTLKATIAPQNLSIAVRGQRLPIRYDPADPARAAYNGPGGDAGLSSSDGGYVAAALLLALAAALGGSGALRFRRVARAAADAQAESEASATQTITKSGRRSSAPRVRVHYPGGDPDLEWSVLKRQPPVSGTVFVRGGPGRGHWLVVRLPDGRLVWPATRARPSRPPRVPAADAVGRGRPQRLIMWALGRAIWFVAFLGAGVLLWTITSSTNNAFRSLTRVTTASVAGSYMIETGSGASQQQQLQVVVDFATRAGGRMVHATIEPQNLTSVRVGQRLPIRYDPADPARAAYNGRGGDAYLSSSDAGYFVAAVFLLPLAAVLGVSGAVRLSRVARAGSSDTETEASATETITTSGQSSPVRRVRVHYSNNAPELEWTVLKRQTSVNGAVFLRGEPGRGHWLVVRLPDRRLIWPATRAQPVIGTGLRLPRVDSGNPGTAGAARRLLAAYVLVFRQVDTLPLFTMRRPQPPPSWWWPYGAPRPVIRWLVAAHQRRRLRALGSALTQTAMLSGADDGGQRYTLSECGRECQALAATLPRRAWLAIIVPAVGIGLSVYATFFPTPKIRRISLSLKDWTHLVDLGLFVTLILVLGFLYVLISAFFMAVNCKRGLFGNQSRTSTRPLAAPQPGPEWDVYSYEREAFEAAGTTQPREWETWPWLGRLITIVYTIAIGVPVLIAIGPIVTLFAILSLLLLVAAVRWGRTLVRALMNGGVRVLHLFSRSA